ncbi:MAG: diacylglycerol kinase family protein [Patescibacteria group bacterium]|nr:diacylglycerol kinase family protein [Patescibacteria group bacterium]
MPIIRIRRLLQSFKHSFRGFKKVVKEEQNFRIELTVGLLVLIVGFILGVSQVEMAILIITIGIVLLMEILNTLIEALTDLLKPKLDYYVKMIKDIAAAAVVVASIVSVGVGLVIFGHYLFK